MDFLRQSPGPKRGSRRGYARTFQCEGLEGRALLALTPIPAAVNFTAGAAPSGPVLVGSFLDSDTGAVPGDFAASIAWGDGHSSAGTVTASTPAGRFDVAGTNIYAAPGSYAISIQVQDYQRHSTSIPSTAYVAGSVLTPIPVTITAAVGQLLDGLTVASFLDTNPADHAQNLAATIAWGDGSVTAGQVVPGAASHLFNVQGTHTYLASGPSAISVLITTQSGQSATANSTAIVAAPVIATGTSFPATAGQSVSAMVATFTNSNPGAAASQAVIDWGDGQTSTGQVAGPSSSGVYSVSGTHTYSTAGVAASLPVTVTIIDPSGQTATARSTALVGNTGASPSLTGSLADVIGNGPHRALGYTTTNRPTFSGTAPPFSVVQLYARRFKIDAMLPLGEAVADASGRWTLIAGPLAPGTYNITATVTPPGGYPSPRMPLANNGVVHIEMSPRPVRSGSAARARRVTPTPQRAHFVFGLGKPLDHFPMLNRRVRGPKN